MNSDQTIAVTAPISVDVFVTHANPHCDEVTGMIQVRKDTSGKFPGANTARVVCPKDDTELEYYVSCPGTLFFGIGAKYSAQCPDRVFDEHGEKHKGRCSADLVALALGSKDSLSGLLAEVRKHDLQSVRAPVSLATVMKVRYRHDSEAEVIKWAMLGMSDLYDHVLSGKVLEITDAMRNEFLDIASNAYVTVGQANKARPELFQVLLEFFHEASLGKVVTDIGYIFYVMMKKDVNNARWWLKKAAVDLSRDQIMLDQGLKEFKFREEIEINVDFAHIKGDGVSKGPVRVAFIHSDNRRMIDVFRLRDAGGCEILVQMNGKGQVSIFSDKLARLKLDVLAQMIRFAENAEARQPVKSWNGLAKDGQVEGIEEWYYFQAAGMILNASNTNPNVKPTRLRYEHFVEIFNHAFTWDGLQSFMKNYRVFAK